MIRSENDWHVSSLTDAGGEHGEGEGEDEEGDQIAGGGASDRLAAGEGDVDRQEEDVGDDVEGESAVADGHAVHEAVEVGVGAGAVEVLDLWHEAEDRNDGRGEQELAQEDRVDFPDESASMMPFCKCWFYIPR